MNPANTLRKLLIPRHLRRAAANADRFWGGVPFGTQPYIAPSVRERYRDLDGQDARAEMRARAMKMRIAQRKAGLRESV